MTNTPANVLKFLGRDAELDLLEISWRIVCDVENPRPQFVTVLGAAGLGKTRLVTEFFRRRIIHSIESESGYWPNVSTFNDRNIDVNIDPKQCDYIKHEIPFLWWGIRSSDVTGENALRNNSLATYSSDLEPHLVAMNAKSRFQGARKNIEDVWVDFAKASLTGSMAGKAWDLLLEEMPLSSLVKWIGTPVFQTIKASAEGLSNKDVRMAFEQKDNTERSIRAENLISDLDSVLNPNSPTFAQCPAVIFLDDAQWIGAEAGMPEFVSQLIYQAKTKSWPLMLIATHWPREYFIQRKTIPSYSSIISNALDHQGGEAYGLPTGYMNTEDHIELHLGPVADLSTALKEHLPGLTHQHSKLIIERSGGSPRFLEQFICYLLEEKGAFVDFDTSNSLNNDGLAEVLNKVQDVEGLIKSRLAMLPEEIQETLCIAAKIGERFAHKTLEAFFHEHLNRELGNEMDKAMKPHYLVRQLPSGLESEFAEPLVCATAERQRKNIRSVADDDLLLQSLKSVLKNELPTMKNYIDAAEKVWERSPLNTPYELVLEKRRKWVEQKEQIIAAASALNDLCCRTFEATEADAEYLLGALVTRVGLTGDRDAARRAGEVLQAFPGTRPKEVLIGEASVTPHLLADGGFHQEALEMWEQEQRTDEELTDLWGGSEVHFTDQIERLKAMADSAFAIGQKEHGLALLERRIGVAREIDYGETFELNGHIAAILDFAEAATEQGKCREASDAMHLALTIFEQLTFLTRNTTLIKIGRLYLFSFKSFLNSNDYALAQQAIPILSNISEFFIRKLEGDIGSRNAFGFLSSMEQAAVEADKFDIARIARIEAERIKNILYAESAMSDQIEPSLGN